MLTTLTTISSSSIGRARAGQLSGVEGHLVRDGQVKRGTSVNGSNGESTLQMVTPQAIEEPKMGLVPQMQAQLIAPLFGARRVFVSTPQYH